ncbi:hypothetical protein OS493_012929 [Desmophyllum pertusum]|uniref:Uncharacterized protein n=1 Tax=Desmophyllum pertusum TaxID=174260 RepID=A0A9W9Z1A7_9CNID|nr:hypothetical protein OS493_012929 [Desmophyllum pertusum]
MINCKRGKRFIKIAAGRTATRGTMSQRKYGRPIVVFDGYDNSTVSTKQMTQQGDHRASKRRYFKALQTTEEIAASGGNALALLYNEKAGQCLDNQRINVTRKKLATKDHPESCRRLGWKTKDGQLIPVMTDLPAAPDNLLRIVRCNCSSGCNTLRCSCRKHTWNVLLHVAQCKGSSCTNSSVLAQEDCGSDDE